MLRSAYGGLAAVSLTLLLVAPLCSDGLNAQSSEFQLSGGLGYSFPDSNGEAYGVGAGLILEYVPLQNRWVGARLYGGSIMSGTRAESCGVSPCAVSSQIGVLGGKARLMIPIPLLSPFLELGAGLSMGAITTRYSYPAESGELPVDESHSGVMVHIPFSLGLAFGSRRQHDVSFEYFPHPGRDHVTGMFSIGVGFTWR